MQVNAWKIETININELRLDPDNPRRMSTAQKMALRRSVERFGPVRAVVARRSDHRVVGGHQLIDVLLALGYETVPVLWWEGTDEEARALNIALNRISGDWDEPKLAAQLAALADVRTLSDALHGFDTTLTDLTGFDTRGVLSLLAATLEKDTSAEDLVALAKALADVPNRPATSQVGDLYECGASRVLCGDARDADSVRTLCEGTVASMLFTDAPYNVHYRADGEPGAAASSGRTVGRRKRPLGTIAGDNLDPEMYAQLLRAALGNATTALAPGGAVYVCGGTSTTTTYDAAFLAAGLSKSSIIVWDKGSLTFGRRDYQSQFELVWFGYRHGAAHQFFGGRTQTDLWTIPRDPGAVYIHPTQKPVELAERAILNSSRPGDVVLDLFGGSGTTLIAAERTGRRGFLMEIDPHYVDVIVARWEAFTGRKAERRAIAAPEEATDA